MVGVAGRVQQASADLSRLDDVLHYERDWRFSQSRRTRRPRRAPPAICRCGSELRLQRARAAADREFLPRRGAGPVGRAGGRIGKRQVHPGQAHHRPVRAARRARSCIDGHTLHAWGRERLSNIVASVDQDIRLFSGTVQTTSPCGTTPSIIDASSPRSTMQD